ncbi:MAG: 6-phospho-beta-glucosidase [Nocardiopsaceae bacterium]|nr:6-phospho-beta-glucosidase [Nocardiopsaceae bacterium]
MGILIDLAGRRKLTLIGGGGVRTPLFVEAASRRAGTLGLEEIALFDTDTDRLSLLGAVSRYSARQSGGPRVTMTTDARAAMEGADFVVTAIRVGGDAGRVADERIPLSHGVLGQETTGPGGFAMALRSVPAILEYAGLLAEVSPKAWLFNFTNPAGLVAQALHDAGHARAIGICDGANQAQYTVAAYLDRDPRDLRAEVYGLNHLSWTRAVTGPDGTELLASLLGDENFRARSSQRFFPPSLASLIGAWANEYLWYYYFADQAVARLTAAGQTRGEEVAARNRALLDQLRAIDPDRDPAGALAAYRAYEQGRRSTYMHYAAPGTAGDPPVPSAPSADGSEGSESSEGYAGVALELMEALVAGVPCHTAVNVPNSGAISGLADDDVVEVSTIADADGVRPVPLGAIPPSHLALVRAVKLYERLTVEAIRTRSRACAVRALMAHPLVLSYSRAEPLVDEFLRAHASLVGEWA